MTFLGSFHFQNLLSSLEYVILDVGARNGILPDLEPVASVTRAIGFEPDPQECQRLNAELHTTPSLWKSEEYVPVALGAKTGDSRTLNLCHEPGCSSLLIPNAEQTERYGRGDDFSVRKSFEIKTLCLDDAARKFSFPEVDFIKLDIQGAELEVLQGGTGVISNGLLGVLSEVEFTSLYRNQPLFSELEIFLRTQGLPFLDFTSERRWRQIKGLEHLRFHKEATIPYSRGALIHGDALFFRTWTPWAEQPAAHLEKLLKLALLFMTFGYLDEAYPILSHPKVKEAAGKRLAFDLEEEMLLVARHLREKVELEDRRERYLLLKKRIRSLVVR